MAAATPFQNHPSMNEENQLVVYKTTDSTLSQLSYFRFLQDIKTPQIPHKWTGG